MAWGLPINTAGERLLRRRREPLQAAGVVRPPGAVRPVDWLKTFGKVYLDGVEDQEKFLANYRAACARHLPDGEIDYVRLRWRAVRQ